MIFLKRSFKINFFGACEARGIQFALSARNWLHRTWNFEKFPKINVGAIPPFLENKFTKMEIFNPS